MIFYIVFLGMLVVFLGAIVILVGYFGAVGGAAASALVLWLPGINQLSERTHYSMADELNNSNPLYARGFMRKNASGKAVWADLRGLYYCQKATILPLGCACIYMLYIYFHDFGHVFWIDIIFIIYFWGLFLVWMVLRSYYCCCYNRDFRYVKGKNGIWKPFSYIAKPPNWGSYKPFHCKYQMDYEEMKVSLIKECKQNGYRFPEEYLMEDGQEAHLFMREEEEGNLFFELIHIKEYSDEWMEKLNEIFVDYWKKYVENSEKKDSYGIIFLLCIDEYNTPLRKRLLSVLSVDQAKGRYRLPAILVYSEHSSLDILANYREWHGGKMYRKMRKELLRMLGMSQRIISM